MKRKTYIIILAVLVVLALCLALFACKNTPAPDDGGEGGGDVVVPGGDDPTPVDTDIATPENLAADSGRVSWKRVTGVTFELEINGKVLDVGNAVNYNLLNYADRPADGKFALRVRAIKDGKAGDWSAVVNYTYVGSPVVNPTVTGIDGTTLRWTASADAQYPLVTVAGVEHKLAADATSYDLSAVTSRSDVSLRYVADGTYYLDSAIIRLVYDPAGPTLAYAGPTNVHMEGEVLYFDRVEGANIYYFADVYNTVTSITGEAINSLSNDRSGHFLVKSMWAGNTDLDIANSEPTPVTYFGEGKGAGTLADPYLIDSLSDMRYIEYYEAVNQSNYYRLTADIEFEPYQPAKDEDYSNFYNLGSFSGVLDGQNHALKNIVVYYKDGYSSIFDNITETGVIKDLVIEDTAWRTWTNRTNDGVMHEKGGECAVLAYTNRGTIEGVVLKSGTITADKDGAAGLVSINRGTIAGCKVLSGATITGANEVGAIAIYNAGTVRDCLNYGTVSGGATVGGIVGRNAGLVLRCGNEGTVTGESTVGGLVGYNYNINVGDGMQYDTLVSQCYNKGIVSGMSFVGGLVGRNGSTGYNELGLTNYANAGLYGCYNRGDVSGIISVGGLVGENCAYYNGAGEDGFGVRACYTSGIVSTDEEFRSGYIYLSVSDCTWAENDNELIYVHYWRGEDQGITSWPGAPMQKQKVGGHDFYVVAVQGNVADVTGLIFNRVNPNNTSGGEGSIHNQTVNIAASAVGGALIYAINDSWTNATAACAGWLAGYNNMVNDCYYAAPDGSSLPLSKTGSCPGCSPMGNESDKEQIAENLNNTLGGADIFVSRDNKYPVLIWESIE